MCLQAESFATVTNPLLTLCRHTHTHMPHQSPAVIVLQQLECERICKYIYNSALYCDAIFVIESVDQSSMTMFVRKSSLRLPLLLCVYVWREKAVPTYPLVVL